MTTVTPSLVKELRERTGVGMAKCKEALEQSQGDIEEAVAFLRKAGAASAVKKAGRATTEGIVVTAETETVVAVAEIDAETDFVVKNALFQEFAQNIAKEVALSSPESVELFVQQPYSQDPELTIDQYRAVLVQTIGENIVIRRVQVFQKDAQHSIGVYIHLGGKLGTVVLLQGAGEESVARDIAMHVAAAAPEYVSPDHVPQELITQEREIARGQVAGKPEHIIDKIVDGKLQSFFEGCCLTMQKYVRDTSLSVDEYLQKQAAVSGKELKVVQFIRWMAGKE